ncbi:MAG: hypothetical protein ACJ75H_19345, partial [Thermoanaerobaculia bacterium]
MGVKRFSERIVAAPFGRYQAGDEVEPPANRVLVGREGQRAFFIDLLLRMGRRGAFLVTGRRGVGKTSFVHHCISEYRNEVYKRFLHSNVGRVTFWDRAGILILMLTSILVALIVSELTEVLMLPAPRSILLWLIVAPLILVCLYPLLYAREVCEEIFEAFWKRREAYRMDAAPATILMLVIAGLAWRYGPFGAPALSMSRLFLGLCVIYLWVQSTSFNRSRADGTKLFRKWNIATIFVVAIIAIGILWPSNIPVAQDTKEEFEGNLLWALALLGSGMTLRGLHLERRFRIPNWTTSPRSRFFQAPQVWYLSFGPLLLLFSFIYLQQEKLYATLFAAAGMSLASLLLFVIAAKPLSRDAEPVSFHPQPLLILAVKALICVIVALQLIHPVLSKATWPRTAVRPEVSPSIDAGKIRSAIPLRGLSGIWLKPDPGTPDSQVNYKPVGSAVFHGKYEELLWLLALFLTLLTVYFLEYEWIIRPFVSEREDSAINPSSLNPTWRDQQPGSEAGRRNYYDLAQLTMPWLLYQAWLPILVVSVNLGFEKLDHRRVVYAMLAGLRDQYHRAFLAWNSGVANLGRGLGFLLLLLLVTLAGDRWFELPKLDTPQDKKWALAQADIDYARLCERFEGRQRGPGAVNIICKTRWGDAIFHVLYYNILQFHAVKHYESRESHLLFYLVPYREDSWPPAIDLRAGNLPSLLDAGINLRIYHLVLLLFFFLIGRWLLHNLPAIPYRTIVD